MCHSRLYFICSSLSATVPCTSVVHSCNCRNCLNLSYIGSIDLLFPLTPQQQQNNKQKTTFICSSCHLLSCLFWSWVLIVPAGYTFIFTEVLQCLYGKHISVWFSCFTNTLKGFFWANIYCCLLRLCMHIYITAFPICSRWAGTRVKIKIIVT